MHRQEAMRWTGAALLALALTVAAGGCTGRGRPVTPAASPGTIPQPPLARLGEHDSTKPSRDSNRHPDRTLGAVGFCGASGEDRWPTIRRGSRW
jgi:hypothetical protein